MSFRHFCEAVEEIELEEKGLTIQGRRKLSRSMKRRKTQLKLARKRARKRMAKSPVLQKRARRSARADVAKQLIGDKKKGQLSIAKKKDIERRLGRANFQARIKMKQRRLMPTKRRQEIGRKR